MSSSSSEPQAATNGLHPTNPFDIFIESVTDYGMFSVDTKGHITEWNVGAARMFGYIEADILGQHYRIVFTPEDIAAGLPEREMAIAQEQGHAHNTYWHLRKDGSRIWVEGKHHALRDQAGNLVGYARICRDLRFQEQLQESEQRFRATFEQAAVGIAHVGLNGRWLRVNERLCAILGYTREELLALTFQEITHPADLQSDLDNVRKLLTGEIPTYMMEKRYICKDGSLTWTNLTVSLMRDAKGKPLYFISVVEDINARKAAEEAAIRYQAHIVSLNKQLQGSITETHHRVKNNLQHVAAFLDMRLLSESISASQRADLRRLTSLVLSLAALHDILTAQAKDYGQTDFVSSKDFLDKVVSLLQQSSNGRRIESEIEARSIPTKIASTLAIILNELITNALKHSANEVEVRFNFVAEARRGELRVCDRGAGFPPDFDPRADANTGLQLVETLTRHDLSGTVYYLNPAEGGACVMITMALPEEP